MASQISDESVGQLQALERALDALTAKQTAAFGAVVGCVDDVSSASMRDSAFCQTSRTGCKHTIN